MPIIATSADDHFRSDIAELKEEMEEGCGETPEIYRKYYRDTFNTETILTNDQIYLMVGNSEDADNPEGWAKAMKEIEEKLTQPA